MAKIYTIGEILVEIMRPETDQPLDRSGSFLGPFPSGAPSIFISAVAQLGHEAKIWGGVGRDRFGDLLLKRLEGDGVDCADIIREEGRATAVAFVSYDSAGDREFIYHIDGTPAGRPRFEPSRAAVPDWFHVMGCSLMVNDGMAASIRSAVEWTAAAGGRISFDPNIRPELLQGRSLWDLAGTVMENCSVFLPGREELLLFSEKDDLKEGIRTLFDRFPKLELIHLKKGAAGSEIHTREEKISIGIYDIPRNLSIVDPTGAGDSFDAAFICALAEGLPLEDAGALAAKAGAINSTVFGPMGGDLKVLR